MDDTRPEVREMQAAIYRRMSGAQRLQRAYEMSVLAREMASARLRQKHPEWSEAEIKRELLRMASGSNPLPEPLR